MSASLLVSATRLEDLLAELLEHARALEAGAGDEHRARASVVHQVASAALQLARTGSAPPDVMPLSPRERQVLELVGRGLTNGEVASVLGVSIATVRTHVEHLLRMLGVSNRVEAVALALRWNLI
jgi:DNA-binding NarL/FixJ family response regulator